MDVLTLVADRYGQEAAEYLREKVHPPHVHRWVDYGACEDCGDQRPVDRGPAEDVAAAAEDVARAYVRLVEAIEEHEQAHGPRADQWATGYPGSRCMREEVHEWWAYADALRQGLPPEPEQAPDVTPQVLADLADKWDRTAGECAERAGEQPASFDEVEDDALSTAYAECAAELRRVICGAAG